MNDEKQEKKVISKKVVLIGSVAMILGALMIICTLFYLGVDQNTPVQFVAKRIPLPVATISGASWVYSPELIASQEAIRKSYERPDLLRQGVRVDFETPDGKKRWNVVQKGTIDKLIEDKVIVALAKESGITVSPKAADQEISRRVSEAGTETSLKQYEEEIKNRYGWSVKTMRDRVVIPELYTKKLYENFAEDENEHEMNRQEAQRIRELITGPEDFEKVAKEHSEGSTAEEGGRLGWLRQQDIIQQVSEVAMTQEIDTVSDVIESSLGYHIILVHARRGDEEKSVDMSQIIVRKKMFGQWIEEKMQDMKIFLPQRQYYWDKTKTAVEFKSEEMRLFEEDLKQSDEAALFGL